MIQVSKSRTFTFKFYFNYLFIFPLVVFFFPALALPQSEISGKVFDLKTGEPLIGVNAVLVGTQLGDATNADGEFSIQSVQPGNYELAVLMIGYETHRQKIAVQGSVPLRFTFSLQTAVILGEEIKVQAKRYEDTRLEISPPTFEISPRMVQATAGGLEDVMRAIQILPGVITVDDNSNQFVVRGGSPNQNLILLDGIELYNPYRRNGMASVFNPELVQSVNFYAGGFPAIFGDRLSSVLSVTLREGTREKWLSGRVGANLTSSNFVLEGKTGFWNGSWIAGARRSYYDAFARDFIERIGIVNKISFPDFDDFQAKIVLHPTVEHRLQFTGFTSRNNFDYLSKDEIGEQNPEQSETFDGMDRLKNAIIGGSWTFIPSNNFQSRWYANWYRNEGNSDFAGNLVPENAFDPSNIFVPTGFGEPRYIADPPVFGTSDTVSFNYSQIFNFEKLSTGGWAIYQTQNHILETGFEFNTLENKLDLELNTNEFGQTVFNSLISSPNWFGALADTTSQSRRYSRWNIYVQDKIKLFEGRATIQPGVRVDYFGIVDQFYFSPRMKVVLDADALTQIHVSSGIYHQSPGHEKFLDGSRIRSPAIFNFRRHPS